MSERLDFTIAPAQSAGHRLHLKVPHVLMDNIANNQAAASRFSLITKKKFRAVINEPGQTSDLWMFNDKRIGDAPNKLQLLGGALWLITYLDKQAEEAQKDPRFQATMGHDASMKILWPALESPKVSRLVGHYAPEFARKLHHPNPDKAYAYLDRRRGVQIHADGAEPHSFQTLSSNYEPGASIFEVAAQGNYSETEKFLCLIGGVVIAKADQLATS